VDILRRVPSVAKVWETVLAKLTDVVKEQAHLKSDDDDALVDQAALALLVELEAPK
jgi:hypothetical protein